MEAAKTGDRSLVLAELRRLIFAEERISTDPDVAAAYLADEGDAEKILALVKPRTVEEIRGLVALANRSGLALYTPMPYGLEPLREGVVVDLSAMDRILSLDTKKLFAVIEPGVTWDRLLPEVEALGLPLEGT